MAKPTKDVNAAINRLRRSAPYLICREPGKYGGSIESDIAAVLLAFEQAGLPASDASPSKEQR